MITPLPKPIPSILPVLSFTFTHPAGTIPEGILIELPLINLLISVSFIVTDGIKYKALSMFKMPETESLFSNPFSYNFF